MRKNRSISVFLLSFMSTLMAFAQDVIVNVTPVQEILPPQAMLYVADPGKYFNISLTNTSSQAQDVYLGMQLQQVMPESGLSISTPPKRQPSRPITVPANGVRQLTMAEIKTLFNHIPSNEVNATPGLLDGYANGSFALLPEGRYKGVITAYRWSSPAMPNPVAVSNPLGGIAYFTVCYKAQAPQFLMPMTGGTTLESSSVADLDALNPMFTWTQPVVACSPMAQTYRYSIKIVEVLKNQSPDDAVERNPVVYRRDNMLAPQCVIPANIISTQFYTDRTYAAQVVATSANANAIDYVMVENGGKSTYRLFRIKTSDTDSGKTDDNNKGDDKKDDGKKNDDDNGNGGGDDDGDAIWARLNSGEMGDSICTDSLYSFRNPRIQKPVFIEDAARKIFINSSIDAEWTSVAYLGGEGKDPDKLKFQYDISLYDGGKQGGTVSRQEAMNTVPVYTAHVDSLTKHTIKWADIKDKIDVGDYLVLKVTPKCTNGTSVAFINDSVNVIDFALCESTVKKYFQCSNMVEIENTEPADIDAADLKGKTVTIGEYDLVLDGQLSGDASGLKGRGHVEWSPMGFRTMVCVEFDGLKINSDMQVIEGVAKGYSNDQTMSDMQVVDKLFSDWGIDNLIGDTGIPYASQIQNTTTGAIKDIAKKVNLSKYYEYVKKGKSIYNALATGEISDLYMPVSLPESINKTPVDIQIVGMTFAPTYATMNIMGEFTLPNSNYLKNDILVLGAPRLCISPDALIPESGTVALLSDFGIVDPKSSYTMTFKAPKDVTAPVDGCYIAWKNYSLELLGVDIDMKIPNLVKEVNGKVTTEAPTLNVRASIGSWDDWMVDNVTIDPFQVKDLPGWTFTATDIVYDHSLLRNSNKMGKFPTGYNKSKAGITSTVTVQESTSNSSTQTYNVGDSSWEGLFIKNIGVKFPKALEIGTSGDKRLNISAESMFFDKSGATLNVTAGNIISAKTGKAGGWSFSLDKVYAAFIQNDFSKCGFSGKFSVPLLSGEVGYDCKIYRQTKSSSSNNQYAYVFKTQQVDGLSLDFFLADAKFNKSQTYFLLEALPNSSGSVDTKVELLLGGDLTIGGTDYLNKKIKNSKLPMKFEIPGVHFCGMRLANCANSWTSTFESTMQKNAKNAKLSGKTLYSGKEITMASGKIYFHTGKWSLASASKKLGPFEFSLDKYDFKYASNKLSATLEGSIKLISGIDLSAGAGFTINADVKLPSDLKNLSAISIKYGSTDFEKASFGTSFAGMELSGSLAVEKSSTSKEGYTGTLKFKMPGDLFTVNANGGYYKYESGSTKYSYGFFYCKLGSNVGIEAPPVKIMSITGGFYYNCKKNGEGATPEKGLIGVIAGLKLATTAGEDALNASVDMTVVYDSGNKRLSSFIFTGDVKAVSDLVSAKCNIVYEHTNTDKYLQLDITVDASADNAKFKNAMTGVSETASSLKKKLNSSFKGLSKYAPTGSLTAMNDNESTPDKSKAPKNGENLSPGTKATIGLQFKITWKEKGTTYNKPHWHLYIGEPEIDKRCSITFLKFKSGIVSVDIGANAYLCLGNELPNNGKLPAIPSKVANFLNGSGDGKGIESASLSQANKARESSVKDFEDQITSIGGGVMFGAQVYGYLDVDLGIFYLDAGATAGFDISIVKLGNNVKCTNFSGDPGYKRWYGYGQLYAYLYAKFGIRINLGFWKKDFDIADAGIGGLFSMQGPRPSHFEGKARVKLKLLGGLVNVDRRFSFECGQSCDLFYGNALDEFKLFGDLSIGYDNKDQGWSEKNAIDPQLLQRPYFTTEAPLNEPFRVLDETEKARLAKNYTGDRSDLDMEASRTFIFRSNVGAYVTLYEYKSTSDTKPTVRNIYLKGQNRYSNYLDLTTLTANRYYKMTVTGYAKEIEKGVEVDPLKYNEYTNKYNSSPWSQSKTYYFRTGPSKAIDDCPDDLSPYIAIAYPSYYNQVKDVNRYITAYVNDVKYPNIAFYSDVSNKLFKKGKLTWRLYNTSGKLVSSSPVRWANQSNPHCCNLTSSYALSVSANTSYHLYLDYEVSKTVSGRAVTETTHVVDLYVTARDGHWQTGYYGNSLDYEKPFIGSSICSMGYSRSMPYLSDYEMSRNNTVIDGAYPRLHNPYMYISYLSNYAFFGGWEFSADRLDANITTCQSLVYTDKGGVYEGKLGTGKDTYNVYNGFEKVRKLSVYSYDQYYQFTEYPLPEIDDPKYNYTLSGLSRVPVYSPSEKNARKVKGYIIDMYSPIQACEWLCTKIKNTLNTDFDDAINLKNKGKDWTNDLNAMESWYQNRRGWYFTEKFNNATLQVPAYQFPIVYGSCLENSGTTKKVTAWGTISGYSSADKSHDHSRGHQKNALWIYSGLIGKQYLSRSDGAFSSKSSNVHNWDQFLTSQAKKYIKNVEFDIYRVNAYDIDKCVYTVNYALYGEDPYDRFTLNNPLDYYNNYDK